MLELAVRPLPTAFAKIEGELDIEPAATLRDLRGLREAEHVTLDTLEAAGTAAAHVLVCPRLVEAEAMTSMASQDAYAAFRQELTQAVAQHTRDTKAGRC